MNPILLIEDEPGLVMTIADLLTAEVIASKASPMVRPALLRPPKRNSY